MPFGYPVMLELAGRRSVVIGGDAVRVGKVEDLLAAGADDVLVVAEGPDRILDELETTDGVSVERRAWSVEDLNGAFLCIASSPDPGERAAIAREARCRRALVNLMDDIPNCDWAAPSLLRRGELIVAIGTGGASPALAKQLRARLSEQLGEEWAQVLAVLRTVRTQTNPSIPSLSERSRRWGEALDLDEAAALVREGRADVLADRLRARLTSEGTDR
jgi:siroheme synthase-like protein